MPPQGRLGDKAQINLDAHGCPACPHPGVGPAIQGSPDVQVNKRPALRVGDPGIHMACCGTNTWTAQRGAASVFVNGKAAFRQSDPTKHCGGLGQLIEGSPNVLVGETGGGGAAAARSAATVSSSGGGSQAAAAASAPGSAGGGSTEGGGPAASGGASASSSGSLGDTASSGASASGGGLGGSASDAGASGGSGDSAPGGATGAQAGDSGSPEEPPPEPWLEVVMVGADGEPLAGVRYLITDARGVKHTGTLDALGTVRLTDIPAGTCEVTFPDLDRDAWEPA